MSKPEPKDGLQIKYSENRTKVSVTTYLNRETVTKVILNKVTGETITEVYEKDCKHPIEQYVYRQTKKGSV